MVAAFGLPVAAPLFALGVDSDALLPVCCRRSGAHHCMLIALDAGTRVSAPGMKCPLYPKMVAPVRRGDAALGGVAVMFGGAVGRSAVKAGTAADVRMAVQRTEPMRGPPAILA